MFCFSDLACSKVEQKISKRKVERVVKDSEASIENAKKTNSEAGTENGRWNNELRNQQHQVEQVWTILWFKNDGLWCLAGQFSFLMDYVCNRLDVQLNRTSSIPKSVLHYELEYLCNHCQMILALHMLMLFCIDLVPIRGLTIEIFKLNWNP